MKVVGLRVALTMMEAMGLVSDSKGGGKGIDGVTGRVTSCEGAINHDASFPGVRHVTGEENQ